MRRWRDKEATSFVCTICQQDKARAAFWPSMLKRSVYQCKPCRWLYIRAWRDKNVDREPGYRSAYHAKLKRDFVEAYGGKCACCGETELGFLSLDHVGGGGRKHRLVMTKGRGGGTQVLLSDLRRRGWPKGFQVLCYNCNLASGFLRVCPHKRAGYGHDRRFREAAKKLGTW